VQQWADTSTRYVQGCDSLTVSSGSIKVSIVVQVLENILDFAASNAAPSSTAEFIQHIAGILADFELG